MFENTREVIVFNEIIKVFMSFGIRYDLIDNTL